MLPDAAPAGGRRRGGPRGTAAARRPTVGAAARRYLGTEAGSGGVLLGATVAALVWANALGDYTAFWSTPVSLRIGGWSMATDLRDWVNDGLVVLFFFVVGLEVVREVAVGELTDRRRIVVPAVAAVVGMAVPALVFATLVPTGPAAHAWGVVVSSDTAFVLGALALIAPPNAAALRVFLLTLAVVDDIGALAVIATVYGRPPEPGPLALALAGIGLLFATCRRPGLHGPVYVVVGTGTWAAVAASGLPPTLAGVAVALVPRAYAARRADVDHAARLARAYRQSPNPGAARAARRGIAASVSDNERLQLLLRPWTSYLVLPVFALANAGVVVDVPSLAAAARSPVTLAVVVALVLGKPLGVLLGTGLAVGLRSGRLPPGVPVAGLVGGAALSGIGFTIALYIVDRAIADPLLADRARIGVLAGSLLSSLIAAVLLGPVARLAGHPAHPPHVLDPPVDPGRDHVRGPADAELTVVEFGDYACSFCGGATGVVRELRELLGDRVRYVYRHAPLVDEHPRAALAAEAAEAAAAQGRFWEMHDRLLAHQDQLGPTALLDHAAAIGLDVPRFARELGERRYAGRVREDAESAGVSGVTGLPTFYVHGRRHTGSHDAATLVAALTSPPDRCARCDPPPRRPPAAVVLRPPFPELDPDAPGSSEGDALFPRLDPRQVDLAVRFGRLRCTHRNEVLFVAPDDGAPVFVVVSGAVAVVSGAGAPGAQLVGVPGPGGFLVGPARVRRHPAHLTALVVRPGEVVELVAPQLRALFTEDPAVADAVERAFRLRRPALRPAR